MAQGYHDPLPLLLRCVPTRSGLTQDPEQGRRANPPPCGGGSGSVWCSRLRGRPQGSSSAGPDAHHPTRALLIFKGYSISNRDRALRGPCLAPLAGTALRPLEPAARRIAGPGRMARNGAPEIANPNRGLAPVQRLRCLSPVGIAIRGGEGQALARNRNEAIASRLWSHLTHYPRGRGWREGDEG